MSKFHRFIVEGDGSFPVDMLRYDSCYPASNAPNDNLFNITLCQHEKDYFNKKRQVTLIKEGDKKAGPTFGRWASFGWKVIKTEFFRF